MSVVSLLTSSPSFASAAACRPCWSLFVWFAICASTISFVLATSIANGGGRGRFNQMLGNGMKGPASWFREPVMPMLYAHTPRQPMTSASSPWPTLVRCMTLRHSSLITAEPSYFVFSCPHSSVKIAIQAGTIAPAGYLAVYTVHARMLQMSATRALAELVPIQFDHEYAAAAYSHRYLQICMDSHRYVQICMDSPRYLQICMDIHRYFDHEYAALLGMDQRQRSGAIGQWGELFGWVAGICMHRRLSSSSSSRCSVVSCRSSCHSQSSHFSHCTPHRCTLPSALCPWLTGPSDEVCPSP